MGGFPLIGIFTIPDDTFWAQKRADRIHRISVSKASTLYLSFSEIFPSDASLPSPPHPFFFAGLIDYNFHCFRKAIHEVFEVGISSHRLCGRQANIPNLKAVTHNGTPKEDWVGTAWGLLAYSGSGSGQEQQHGGRAAQRHPFRLKQVKSALGTSCHSSYGHPGVTEEKPRCRVVPFVVIRQAASPPGGTSLFVSGFSSRRCAPEALTFKRGA